MSTGIEDSGQPLPVVVSNNSVSVVSILLSTVLCQKTSDGVSPRHCVNVKTKKSSKFQTKKGRHLLYNDLTDEVKK